MKRYLLFAGWIYYPSGGWKDLVESFSTIEDALDAAFTHGGSLTWYQIVDTSSGAIVRERENVS
jgi:hypothetical protein